MNINLSDQLTEAGITAKADAADWRAAIRLAGAALVASGATTDQYTEEMIVAVEDHGPYIVIAPGLALAHSRPSPAVHRAGISWVTLATPVEFGSATNDPVDLVIGLAATDHDSHLEMMSALAATLMNTQALDRLRAATSPSEVRALLTSTATH